MRSNLLGSAGGQGLGLLLEMDLLRLGSAVRNPTASGILGIVLPAAVVVSALVVLGSVGVPSTDGAAGAVTLGMLVAGGISFAAYGVIFSTADQAFIRRLGIPGDTVFVERGIRLQVLALVVSFACALPYRIADAGAGRAWAIAFTVGTITAAVALVSYAIGARMTVDPRKAQLMSAGMGQFDPELARAAPLVYAPIMPFLCGTAFAAFAGGIPEISPVTLLAAVAVALSALWLGMELFAPAAPLFTPRVSEMAFTPPPEKGGEEFRVGRGVSMLLPRRAAAAWVRDAIVGARRFPWASRVTWPVVIASFFALARWGDAASTRAWVLAAVGIALLVQSAAVVGLGVLERDGPRWIDRLTGIPTFQRFLGRWAWGWEISLWLLVPIALAWSWWSGQGIAWGWPFIGAASAALAAIASLLNAERKS